MRYDDPLRVATGVMAMIGTAVGFSLFAVYVFKNAKGDSDK